MQALHWPATALLNGRTTCSNLSFVHGKTGTSPITTVTLQLPSPLLAETDPAPSGIKSLKLLGAEKKAQFLDFSFNLKSGASEPCYKVSLITTGWWRGQMAVSPPEPGPRAPVPVTQPTAGTTHADEKHLARHITSRQVPFTVHIIQSVR